MKKRVERVALASTVLARRRIRKRGRRAVCRTLRRVLGVMVRRQIAVELRKELATTRLPHAVVPIARCRARSGSGLFAEAEIANLLVDLLHRLEGIPTLG